MFSNNRWSFILFFIDTLTTLLCLHYNINFLIRNNKKLKSEKYLDMRLLMCYDCIAIRNERRGSMVDTDKLRGIIAERGLSQRKVAKNLGISEKTFYIKMKNGVFDSDEMSKMVEILSIKDPARIFFAEFVSQ
nr:MAG TPA: antitoxin [Caudoviricetes sp.]